MLACSAPSAEPTGRYRCTGRWNAPSRGCPSCSSCECNSDNLETGGESKEWSVNRCTETVRHFLWGGNTYLYKEACNTYRSSTCKIVFYADLSIFTHWYLAEGFKLQEGEMLSQLNGLQVVEEERDLPLFTAVSFNLLAGLPGPVPFISSKTWAHSRWANML